MRGVTSFGFFSSSQGASQNAFYFPSTTVIVVVHKRDPSIFLSRFSETTQI
jgi:hypothetical protein